MKLLRQLPIPILTAAAILMLAAPFVPEPHLVEKARLLMNGELNRPIDIFDVFWHLLPTALLVWRLNLWRKDRAAASTRTSGDDV